MNVVMLVKRSRTHVGECSKKIGDVLEKNREESKISRKLSRKIANFEGIYNLEQTRGKSRIYEK